MFVKKCNQVDNGYVNILVVGSGALEVSVDVNDGGVVVDVIDVVVGTVIPVNKY
jgi:hypothetical protein